MDHGRFSLAVLVPVVLVLSPPCPAQPSNVTIIGDGEVGGLEWDAVDESWKCVFQFRAEGIPPQTVCDLNFEWSFDGCGASPEISNEQEPVVRFSMTGVCQITMRAWLTGEVCESEEWTPSATYYVIGGPFTIGLVDPKAGWTHDDQDPSEPWYITFHGWDPAQGAWPEHLQSPVGVVATADFDQPEGTTFTWTFPANLLHMVNAEQNGTTGAASATFYARNGSAAGAILLRLTYCLAVNGVPNPFDDDTKACKGEKYPTFTAHKPTGTVFHSLWHIARPGPPRNPGPYEVRDEYLYRLKDHLGLYMPDTLINERFTSPIPPNFIVNTPDDGWWRTDHVGGQDSQTLGRFLTTDKIFSGEHWTWRPRPTMPPVWGPFNQEYWAGSLAVDPDAPGGCKVGARTMTIWSDATEHVPANWP